MLWAERLACGKLAEAWHVCRNLRRPLVAGVFGGTLAGVECKRKGGWEVGLGERRVDGAHREIEKVEVWGC